MSPLLQMPFLMHSTACSHTQRMAISGSSFQLLKKSGAITLMFSWVRTFSTTFSLWASISCSGQGFLRWWGAQTISFETYWMILASRYTSSSLFSRKAVASRRKMLKFSWLVRTSSLISHFSNSERKLLLSMRSMRFSSLTELKGLSLLGRMVCANSSPVSCSTRFMFCRWLLRTFSSKLVLLRKSKSRCCTRCSSSPSIKLVRQQVSSSSFISSSYSSSA